LEWGFGPISLLFIQSKIGQLTNIRCLYAVLGYVYPMNRYRSLTPYSSLALVLTLTLSSGCIGPKGRVGRNVGDRAFINHYNPTPPQEGRLRLAVKDFIDIKGQVTTAGSEYLAKTRPPATRDAACLAGARAQNVVIVGKTNAAEFGVTSSGVNDFFGTPRSPLNPKEKRIPGGSSSGSAVAVATGMADVAFGTDTGGSVRIPAANCGVYGLKTTFGLVPLKGVFPLSPKHLDTVGPLAKDLPRLVQGMDLLKPGFAGQYRAAVASSPSRRQITIGRLYVDGTDPAIEQAVDKELKASGFKVVRLSNDFKKKWEQAQKDGKIVALADAWVNDQQYMDKKGVNLTTKGAILLGRIEYATSYKGALERKKDWQRTLRQTFRYVDFIVLPTMRRTPPKIPYSGSSPIFETAVFDQQNTVAMNLSGNPALAVPIPLESEEPIPATSMQVVGPLKSEAQLLNVARLMQSKR
jgi:Asp-tRNA(Asn)/Glu-tRNA(Gln) amidotransferase A subunit family amidase